MGYGGHTAMLDQLGRGHIYATDVDPESLPRRRNDWQRPVTEKILTIKLQNFCTIDEIAKGSGGFDFILADLGVSSMQIDNPSKRFFLQGGRTIRPQTEPTAGASVRQERLDTITRRTGGNAL